MRVTTFAAAAMLFLATSDDGGLRMHTSTTAYLELGIAMINGKLTM
jgi:hypothetical protein